MKIERPNRVTRTLGQRLAAEPAEVCALLCPVREADWIGGWDPIVVFSRSGVAEPDCVFVTEASPDNAVCYITRHEATPSSLHSAKNSIGSLSMTGKCG